MPLIRLKELGKNEKVKMNAIDIPKAIIFPNSMTGFNLLIIVIKMQQQL